MSISTISQDPPQSVALESILQTKHLRKYAPSIRVLSSIWIKDEQIERVLVDSTLQPIVEYFERAPGLQREKAGLSELTAKALALQMRDMRFQTKLAPCMLKVLVALHYTEEHLDALTQNDFQRLQAMIVAVRKQLHIETAPPPQVMFSAEVVHARGTE